MPKRRLQILFLLILTTMTGFLLLRSEKPVFGENTEWLTPVLQQSWFFYKRRFMEDDARVISNHYGGSISEGQSYALLKSVWMEDRPTFDRAFQWTVRNMKRPGEHLFGWRWGWDEQTKTSRLLEAHNATDADQDIAYALLLAWEQWRDPQYLDYAKGLIDDLWRVNVSKINDRYYLNPGTWEGFHQADALTLDPSYFAPYVYRKFAEYDTTHDWRALAEDIYPVLEACTALTENKLPPNWCSVNRRDNTIAFSDVQGDGARNFGYDAFRVFWRMSMDDNLGSQQARAYLQNHPALLRYWAEHKMLPEGFSPTGEPLSKETSGFALSAALAQSHQLSEDKSGEDKTFYDAMLGPHYHAEGYWFNDYNDYLHSVIWLHLYSMR